MKIYKKLIENCLKIANKAQGKVSPNPLVGAMIVDENNNIISVGYHEKYGEAHAEVNAIKKAGEKAKGGLLAVNLEPCSHYGKTPPCADLIIKSGIKKVIVGMKDPNPKVNGAGIKKLQDAGIEVITGICEGKCKKENEIFITNHTKNKTFVAIKAASTIDGKIASFSGDSKWITSDKSRLLVHKLRNKYDAILTSSDTVLFDNPSMTCRLKNGRNPIRIVVDRTLKTSFNSKIYDNNGSAVYIATDNHNILPPVPDYIEFIKCPVQNDKLDLKYLLDELYKKSIMSVLVEAGGTFNGSLIKTGYVDKFYHFVAPKIFGDSNAKNLISGFSFDKVSDTFKLNMENIKKIGQDYLVEYYF